MNTELHRAYLGLGSNLGDKEENLRRAVRLIREQIGDVRRQSALYYSEPWGFRSDNAFVNAVVMVETPLSPHRLLRATQRIERIVGKRPEHATTRPEHATTHPAESLTPPSSPLGTDYNLPLLSEGAGGRPPLYHDRPIDIDILLYDDLHIDEPHLKIPHPLMQERDFVMVPLREILQPVPPADADGLT